MHTPLLSLSLSPFIYTVMASLRYFENRAFSQIQSSESKILAAIVNSTKLNGGFHHGRGMGIYEYHFVKPVSPQVESLLEARARVWQTLQNRLHSRLVPIQGGGCDFVRKSGGTGVFLPRVFNTHTDFGKKQGMRNRREIEAAQQMPSMKRSGVVKLEESHCLLTPVAPDMSLPQDWIY